jgi:hypothetical protein
MAEPPPAALTHIHQELIKLTQAWALRRPFDAARAADLRRQAVLLNHQHYLATIPAYQRLAGEAGIDLVDDLGPLVEQLLVSDDLFKSYSQRWLDENDFGRMNGWLSTIHHRPVQVDVAGVASIDGWIDRLGQQGVLPVYSSGTSGAFSFIPRDRAMWELVRLANTCYLLPLLTFDKLGAAWQRLLVRGATSLLSPAGFSRLVSRVSVKPFDAVFLDFQGGRTGMQAIGEELAPAFRRTTFLYPIRLSANVLRSLRRGPRSEAEFASLQAVQVETSTRREQNYGRVVASMASSAAEGKNVFMFGTPALFKELCEVMTCAGQRLALPAGSLILFGGGWKGFGGERIPRPLLVAMIADRLGLDEARILEGYSMTEINVFTVRCDHGRFHIPPLVEPLILDEALRPLAGPDLRGIFAFLDPLATAYPGFVASGDEVHLVDGPCPCGLSGPAVVEIGRARARELKGCGGVMASLAA